MESCQHSTTWCVVNTREMLTAVVAVTLHSRSCSVCVFIAWATRAGSGCGQDDLYSLPALFFPCTLRGLCLEPGIPALLSDLLHPQCVSFQLPLCSSFPLSYFMDSLSVLLEQYLPLSQGCQKDLEFG